VRGIRNSQGFDWQPITQQLWFTDQGRDGMMGGLPPDELNYAPRSGFHFGYPHCHGNEISDPDYGRKNPYSKFKAPMIELDSRVGAAGMRFYTGLMFPSEYQNQLFIAEHGHGNGQKRGSKITLVKFERGNAISSEVFAKGWMHEGQIWGRPVDLLVMPDGSLLVSDDHLGVLYRITYEGSRF